MIAAIGADTTESVQPDDHHRVAMYWVAGLVSDALQINATTREFAVGRCSVSWKFGGPDCLRHGSSTGLALLLLLFFRS